MLPRPCFEICTTNLYSLYHHTVMFPRHRYPYNVENNFLHFGDCLNWLRYFITFFNSSHFIILSPTKFIKCNRHLIPLTNTSSKSSTRLLMAHVSTLSMSIIAKTQTCLTKPIWKMNFNNAADFFSLSVLCWYKFKPPNVS